VLGVNGRQRPRRSASCQQLSDEGKKVILAAGDTFRRPRTEQLEEWG